MLQNSDNVFIFKDIAHLIVFSNGVLCKNTKREVYKKGN